ncbi:MAG: sulfurtransferase complex subunit TusD [Colwellia sp.]|nr:sulfurtransferase complex subunit TusD [Colwellia sp.]
MQTLAVMVTTPPHSNLTTTAIDYIECAIQKGIKVIGVFFYQDGVLNASSYLSLPNDEYQSIKQWQRLNKEYDLPLHICVTAGEKRGLTDEIDDQTGKKTQTNINDAFILSGLGELVELSSKADRVVQL